MIIWNKQTISRLNFNFIQIKHFLPSILTAKSGRWPLKAFLVKKTIDFVWPKFKLQLFGVFFLCEWNTTKNERRCCAHIFFYSCTLKYCPCIVFNFGKPQNGYCAHEFWMENQIEALKKTEKIVTQLELENWSKQKITKEQKPVRTTSISILFIFSFLILGIINMLNVKHWT